MSSWEIWRQWWKEGGKDGGSHIICQESVVPISLEVRHIKSEEVILLCHYRGYVMYTSVPMDISAACRTSSSTSSDSTVDRSASLIPLRSPTHIPHTHTHNQKWNECALGKAYSCQLYISTDLWPSQFWHRPGCLSLFSPFQESANHTTPDNACCSYWVPCQDHPGGL